VENGAIWRELLGPQWKEIREKQDKDDLFEALLERAWQVQQREKRAS
jgi:hypothetical protein